MNIKQTLRFFRSISLILIIAPAVSPATEAAKEKDVKQKIMARVQAAQNNLTAKTTAIKAGKDHAIFCAYCHGADGNSTKPDIPNLADQDPGYLLDQIERFADGRRKDYTTVMQQLSRQLMPEEKVALVVYYASVSLKPAKGDPVLAEKGERLYLTKCQQCHGPDGRSKLGYSRIAGQQPGYVRKTLTNFRDQKVSRRTSPVMFSAAKDLTDADITALSEYVAGMYGK